MNSVSLAGRTYYRLRSWTTENAARVFRLSRCSPPVACSLALALTISSGCGGGTVGTGVRKITPSEIDNAALVDSSDRIASGECLTKGGGGLSVVSLAGPVARVSETLSPCEVMVPAGGGLLLISGKEQPFSPNDAVRIVTYQCGNPNPSPGRDYVSTIRHGRLELNAPPLAPGHFYAVQVISGSYTGAEIRAYGKDFISCRLRNGQ